MLKAEHHSISIARAPADIYAFAAQPENLPQWAAGLSGATVERAGEDWICDSPMGRVKVRFAAKNAFGVMDHDVTLPNGEVVHNPFRVLKNGAGGEVVFTLYARPGMSEEDLRNDGRMIDGDLRRLKALLENR